MEMYQTVLDSLQSLKKLQRIQLLLNYMDKELVWKVQLERVMERVSKAFLTCRGTFRKLW